MAADLQTFRLYYPEYETLSDEELSARLGVAAEEGISIESYGALQDVPGTRPPADPRPPEVIEAEDSPPSEPAALAPPRPPEEQLLDARRAQDADLASEPFTRRTAATTAVRPREPGLVTLGEEVIHEITKGGARALGNTAAKAINLIPPGLSRIYGGPNPEMVARDVETWLRETTAMHPDPAEMGEGWYNPTSPNFLKGLDKAAPGISGHLAQFTLPYLVGVGAGAPSMVASFGAGATAFDTQPPRLSNLIQAAGVEGIPIIDPVTKYMEAKPGDTMAFGALMNGLEFAGLDATLGAVFAGGLKLHKVARNAARRGQNVERAVELARAHPGYDDLLELDAATKMLDDVPPVGTGTVLRPPGVKGKIAKAVTKKVAKGALPQQEPLVAAKDLPDPLDLPSSPEYTAPETLAALQELGVKDARRLAQEIQDIPLGVRRGPVIDLSLKRLSDRAFETRRASVFKELDNLEAKYDANPSRVDTDLGFRKKLAKLQDQYEAFELETFRRQMAEYPAEDVAFELRQLGTRSDSDKAKVALLLDEVKKRGIQKQIKPYLEEYAKRSPNHAEVLEGKLRDFQKISKEIAPKSKLEKLALAEDPTAHASQFDQRKLDALVRDLGEGRMDPRAGKVALPTGAEMKAGWEGAKAAGLPVVKGLDKLIRPVKSRIIAAHPEAGPRVSTILDFFELEQNMIAHEAYEKLDPLMRMYTRLKKADKAAWNSAYKRNEMPKLYDIALRYERNKVNPGMRAELTNARRAFDQMHDLANAHGIELAYHESTKGAADYLPLKVRNYKKFREQVGLTNDEFTIQLGDARKAYAKKRLLPGKAADEYFDASLGVTVDPMGDLNVNLKSGEVYFKGVRQPKAELTDHLVGEEVYKFLRKKERGEAILRREKGESFTKERKIDMTKELEPLYGDFTEVVTDYPRRLGYAIARKRLMGEVPGAEQQGYMQVLKQMRKDGALTKEEFGKVSGEIAELVGTRLRGGERGVSNFAKGYRDFVYATTIANPFSTLTQSSEFMLNAYRNGWINNLAGTGKASLDNLPVWMKNALKIKDKGVRMKDLGLSDLGAEYRGTGSGRISGSIHKLLNGGIIKGVKIPGAINLSGFKKMDVFMKEANLNGALRKAKAQLDTKAGAAAFEKRMRPFYGDETDALMQGIKSGNKNDDLTRLYLYQELAKTQPISLSEMPEQYLVGEILGMPNLARSSYFLKSFGLKQMETLRRDVLRQLVSGDKKVAAEGVYNALGLGLLFGGGTWGQNALKDFLAGRHVETDEYLLESGMNLGGLSRYNVYDFRHHGPWIGTMTIFAPPMPGAKELGRGDLESLKKYFPGLGKLWHWRYGAGAKQEAEDHKRRIRKSRPGGRPPRGEPGGRPGGRPPYPEGYPQGTGTVLRP